MKPLKVKNVSFGEGMPKICIPIMGKTEEEIVSETALVKTLPHQVVEWRADHYREITDHGKTEAVLRSLRELLPESVLLFTFRTHHEGGARELSEKDYLEICEHAVSMGLCDLVDFELFTGCKERFLKGASAPGPEEGPLPGFLETARMHGVPVILSSHDFRKTPEPEELLLRLRTMERLGAGIAKLAVMPKSEKDVLALLAATREAADTVSCPVITMSMGAMGVISRVSGRLTGSCMTFGSAGRASAPGQLPAGTLSEILEIL